LIYARFLSLDGRIKGACTLGSLQDLLEKVGKKLKKNNVSVDVVSFGECAEANREKLEAFVAAVNKDSNSNYVEAPMGSNLSDYLLSSPIVSQAYGGGDGGAGPGPAAGQSEMLWPCS
jgi:26S proteasome regulatory subunit N10